MADLLGSCFWDEDGVSAFSLLDIRVDLLAEWGVGHQEIWVPAPDWPVSPLLGLSLLTCHLPPEVL